MAGKANHHDRKCAVCGKPAAPRAAVEVYFTAAGRRATFNLCPEHADAVTVGDLREIARQRLIDRAQRSGVWAR